MQADCLSPKQLTVVGLWVESAASGLYVKGKMIYNA